MIVEVALCGNGSVFFRDNRMDKFLGGGFTIAPGQGYDFGIGIISMVRCQLLQSGQNIFK